MDLDRRWAAQLGEETLNILNAGSYHAPSGAKVEIAESIRRAAEGTLTYPPGQKPGLGRPRKVHTRIELVNRTTLETAWELSAAGQTPAALNFASANHPGGGFLTGARAQEESLARSSALYACLVNNEMCAFHHGRGDAMYTDYAIYSPDVPVFRGDHGILLEEPYPCSFITAPAPNAKVVLQRDPRRASEIRSEMRSRIDKVLRIAAAHGHSHLILGAWGCGAFGNDPEQVAELFREALGGKHENVFDHVTFAILDTSNDESIIGPFRQAFT